MKLYLKKKPKKETKKEKEKHLNSQKYLQVVPPSK